MNTYQNRNGELEARRNQLRDGYRITDAWRDLGFERVPAVSCRCPWREDQKPSFSVFNDGRSFKDFSTDESGDVFSFVMRALGLTFKDAVRWIEERIGVCTNDANASQDARKEPRLESKKSFKLPPLDEGDKDDLDQVFRTRGVLPYTVEIAVKIGSLRFGQVCGQRSWILIDADGKLAEARRLDGKPYEAIGKLPARKAHTLAGSSKSWPLGLKLVGDPTNHRPGILLVEGGPDYLAAIDFLVRFRRQKLRPVAMLGKSNRIPDEALDTMARRRVRIYPHHDPNQGGMRAAHDWARQLASVGCEVDGFRFDGLTKTNGKPVTDLNDLLFADMESRKAWKGVLP